MSETQHTPGPWAIEPMHPGWAVKRPGMGVVFMVRRTRALAQKACDEENERYRLNLIKAAAPDLLAALKWAEAALAPFSKEPAEKSGINMIRAAIAKAEGAVMPNKRGT